jgi:hypothetical protein
MRSIGGARRRKMIGARMSNAFHSIPSTRGSHSDSSGT